MSRRLSSMHCTICYAVRYFHFTLILSSLFQFTVLNTPKSSPSALRPLNMIQALSHPEPGKCSPLFSSHEHQDAQELFQLLTECVKKEAVAVDREGRRDRGLISLHRSSSNCTTDRQVSKSVFDGLTANRRSCVECGYTEAVMHFGFDSWQLTVPRHVVSPLSFPVICN
jgi:ubiquitin carboxyl-terminal hydrolase 1